MDIVYFDLETQRTANDAGGWDKKAAMGMTVGATYSTGAGRYTVYGEDQVHDLVGQLQRADLVVGFNVINFDYEVLMGYTVIDLAHSVPTLDLMVSLEEKIGHRIGLDSVAQSTIGCGKTADGLDAINRLRFQRANTPRRTQFIVTRREVEALELLASTACRCKPYHVVTCPAHGEDNTP